MNKVRHTLVALILAAVSASAPTAVNAAPFPHIFHLHPQTAVAQVTRYTFTIFNNTYAFQQFKIDGITHTVPSHYHLIVTAPAGTRIYAASKIGESPRGSLLFTVTPQYDAQHLVVE